MPGYLKTEETAAVPGQVSGQDTVVSGHQPDWVDMGPLKLVTLYNNHIKSPVSDKKYKNIIYK